MRLQPSSVVESIGKVTSHMIKADINMKVFSSLANLW